MNFYFCEGCGKRLTEHDIDAGAARNKKLKGVYCQACAVGVSTMESLPLTQSEADKILAKEPPSKKPPSKPTTEIGRKSTGINRGHSAKRMDPARRGQDPSHALEVKAPSASILILGALGLLAITVAAGLLWGFNKSGTPSKKTAFSKRRNAAPNDTPVLPAPPIPDPQQKEVIATLPPSDDQTISAEEIKRPEAKPPGTEPTKRVGIDLDSEEKNRAEELRQKEEAEAQRRKAELEAIALQEKNARTAFLTYLKTFATAVGKADAIGLANVCRAAQADPKIKTYSEDVAALQSVAEALVEKEAERKKAQKALMDGKQHTFRTAKEKITGLVEKIEEDVLTIKVQGRINAQTFEYKKSIKIADLTDPCREHLFGKYEPSDASSWLLRAFEKLAENNLAAAEKVLAFAGKHRLVPLIKEHIDKLRAERLNREGEKYWTEHLERWVRNKNLDATRAKEVSKALEKFNKRYSGTLFARSVSEKIKQLKETLRKTEGLIAHWKFEADAPGGLYADATGNGHTGKPTGEAKASSDVPPGHPEDKGSILFENQGGIQLEKIYIGTIYSCAVWFKFNRSILELVTCTEHKGHILYCRDRGSGLLHRNGKEIVGQPCTLTEGKWHYAVITRENKKITHYLDGKLLGTSQQLDNPPLHVGSFGNRNRPCQYSDIRLYTRALSAVEVRALFEGGDPNRADP